MDGGWRRNSYSIDRSKAPCTAQRRSWPHTTVSSTLNEGTPHKPSANNSSRLFSAVSHSRLPSAGPMIEDAIRGTAAGPRPSTTRHRSTASHPGSGPVSGAGGRRPRTPRWRVTAQAHQSWAANSSAQPTERRPDDCRPPAWRARGSCIAGRADDVYLQCDPVARLELWQCRLAATCCRGRQADESNELSGLHAVQRAAFRTCHAVAANALARAGTPSPGGGISHVLSDMPSGAIRRRSGGAVLQLVALNQRAALTRIQVDARRVAPHHPQQALIHDVAP
jgi:hypothetical protein